MPGSFATDTTMTLLTRLRRALSGTPRTAPTQPRPRSGAVSARRRPQALDPALIARCQQRLHELVLQLQAAGQWPASRPVPGLEFGQRGKAAGTAHLGRWLIRLNPLLLTAHPQRFLGEVIPHELAHLLVFARHGRTRPHGPEWRQLMQQQFGLPPRVTHDLDVSAVSGPQFAYRCACRDHLLSLRRHNRVVRHQARYLCRLCGQPLAATSDAAGATPNHQQGITETTHPTK